MPRYLFALFALLLAVLAGCSPEAVRTRQWKQYVKELKNSPPVPPDTATGQYAPAPELEILDELLRKYPGRQMTRTVVRTETVTVPGKTVYVEVKARPDTARNRVERDSLIRRLETLVRTKRADAELRAEVARLKLTLLHAFNARACLPDTTVRFAEYDLTLTITRGAGGRYGFTWRKGPHTVQYDAQVTEHRNGRVVVTPAPVWWRDEWFWLALGLGALSAWLLYLRLRDARPAAR